MAILTEIRHCVLQRDDELSVPDFLNDGFGDIAQYFNPVDIHVKLLSGENRRKWVERRRKPVCERRWFLNQPDRQESFRQRD